MAGELQYLRSMSARPRFQPSNTAAPHPTFPVVVCCDADSRIDVEPSLELLRHKGFEVEIVWGRKLNPSRARDLSGRHGSTLHVIVCKSRMFDDTDVAVACKTMKEAGVREDRIIVTEIDWRNVLDVAIEVGLALRTFAPTWVPADGTEKSGTTPGPEAGDTPTVVLSAPQVSPPPAPRIPTPTRRLPRWAGSLGAFTAAGLVTLVGVGAAHGDATPYALPQPPKPASRPASAATPDVAEAPPMPTVVPPPPRIQRLPGTLARVEAVPPPVHPSDRAEPLELEPEVEPPPPEFGEHQDIQFWPAKPEKMSYREAQVRCAELDLDGGGWNVATLGELHRLTRKEVALRATLYWSSTGADEFQPRALVWNPLGSRAVPVVAGWRGAHAVCTRHRDVEPQDPPRPQN